MDEPKPENGQIADQVEAVFKDILDKVKKKTPEVADLLPKILLEVKNRVERQAISLPTAVDNAVTEFKRIVAGLKLKHELAKPGLTVTTNTEGSINLKIDENIGFQSNNPDGFEIHRCVGAGCSDFSKLTIVNGAVRDYVDSALSPNTTYCYKVCAFNSLGFSEFSHIKDATP